MAWETIDCPQSAQFKPVSPDGIRVSAQSCGRNGRRIIILIGHDLAKKIGWAAEVERCRIMVGRGGTDEGKVAVAADRGGSFAARRRKNGSYELRIGFAATRGRFRTDFEMFERSQIEAIRPTNGQPPFFSFLAGNFLETDNMALVA